ncbi:TonB-dependent siderophore receptor [Actinobacillus genomosp. 2]|uniref:TonB-dependent siderophore receptor n=1 Tax=Actinobacillus genomosp. 2 TaxID=230709 RepID=UPI0024423DFC|nr:TonB-dependent siderophore receptor [Actinobacillus genomosp. 2]WGE31357.1 TonB-dependent siderophore receptor [Actinobacillus genomosp. 2]
MKKTFFYSTVASAVALAISPAIAQETAVLDEVSVVGSVSKAGKVEYMTPKSVNVINDAQIADENAQKVDQALRYEAGIVTEPYGGDNDTDWFKIRGFDASMTLDGTALGKNGFFVWLPNTYGLESIEVVKGADSFTYGAVETGGLVNLVSKRPSKEPKGEIKLTGGNKDERGVSFDVSNQFADNLRYRVVGDYNKRHGQLNGTWLESYYFAPSLTWDISNTAALTLLASVQKDVGVPVNPFLPAYGSLIPTPNGTISHGVNLGEPSQDYTDRSQYSLGYEYTNKFSEGWQFTQNYRFSRLNIDQYNTFAWSSDQVANASRGYAYTVGHTNNHTFDNRISKNWNIGEFDNTTTVGVDYQHSETKGINEGFGQTVNSINMFNPIYGQTPYNPIGKSYNLKTIQLGLYAQNQLRYKNWLWNVSARNDDVRANSESNGAITGYNVSHNSYSTGLMYQFDNGLAPYANYSESFRAVSGNDDYGRAYKPFEGKQYEVGFKYLPSFINGTFSLAWFDLEEKNTLIADPSNISVQAGKQKSHGVELQANLGFTDNLSGQFAYTYTKAKTDLSVSQSIRSALIPRHAYAAKLNYRFADNVLNGLTVGAGIRYVGSTTDEQYYKGYKIGHYTLADLSAKYEFAKNWVAQVNVDNLFNKKYLASCSFYCYYGEGRKVTANLTYKF